MVLEPKLTSPRLIAALSTALAGCVVLGDGQPCQLRLPDGGVLRSAAARELGADRHDVLFEGALECGSTLCGRPAGPISEPDSVPLTGAVCVRACVAVGDSCPEQPLLASASNVLSCRFVAPASEPLARAGFEVDAGVRLRLFCMPRRG